MSRRYRGQRLVVIVSALGTVAVAAYWVAQLGREVQVEPAAVVLAVVLTGIAAVAVAGAAIHFGAGRRR
ncbi:hypothetical protein ACIBF5_09905 [Micromonospora sp. NPDC050417]|uniref:hypothetical protein n=1 Tax=Micromonospora sp. NPDC050417 TaxID=3364280 RepID=UPI0037A2B6C1